MIHAQDEVFGVRSDVEWEPYPFGGNAGMTYFFPPDSETGAASGRDRVSQDMRGYLVRRVLELGPVALGVTIVSFVLTRLTGDPTLSGSPWPHSGSA